MGVGIFAAVIQNSDSVDSVGIDMPELLTILQIRNVVAFPRIHVCSMISSSYAAYSGKGHQTDRHICLAGPLEVGKTSLGRSVARALGRQSTRMILASLFSGKPASSDVGTTVEITLRGCVLPIGGIKMKALAAHRAGFNTVILPKRNETDLDDLPDGLRSTMHFVTIDNIDNAISEAFSKEFGSDRQTVFDTHETDRDELDICDGDLTPLTCHVVEENNHEKTTSIFYLVRHYRNMGSTIFPQYDRIVFGRQKYPLQRIC